jgi:hypothetical protein
MLLVRNHERPIRKNVMDEEAAIRAELKKWGEDNVRHLLASNQLSLVFHGPALRWIEELDRASAEESEQHKNASIAEQYALLGAQRMPHGPLQLQRLLPQ